MFRAEFFNNVCAVAVVLMFAKIMSHRVRGGPRLEAIALVKRTRPPERVLSKIHLVTVGASAAAMVASLVAVDVQSQWWLWHVGSWVALAVAALGLILDVVVHDLMGSTEKRAP